MTTKPTVKQFAEDQPKPRTWRDSGVGQDLWDEQPDGTLTMRGACDGVFENWAKDAVERVYGPLTEVTDAIEVSR